MIIKSHAPENYDCPICLGLLGSASQKTLIKASDFVYRDELVSAFINTFFIGKNGGHVIVVPNEHFENIYTLPVAHGHRIFDVAQMIALAMKAAYDCDGITTRNNNEPAGDQHAFHYHFHVFPRYVDDDYNSVSPAEKRLTEPAERAGYAAKIKAALAAGE
ncbi:HIT domain-containing protein [Candidatus Saccharibacteria bacterium]|nr:HIT domain-containing protein [Candidatus Saccharibacteria bacterium]